MQDLCFQNETRDNLSVCDPYRIYVHFSDFRNNAWLFVLNIIAFVGRLGPKWPFGPRRPDSPIVGVLILTGKATGKRWNIYIPTVALRTFV